MNIDELAAQFNEILDEITSDPNYEEATPFYSNIIALCRYKHISASEMLKRCNASKSSLSHWKNGGMPSVEVLKNISEFFNVPMNALLIPDGVTICSYNSDRNSGLSDEENNLIDMYRNIPERYKEVAVGKLKQYVPKTTLKLSLNNASAGTGFSFFDSDDEFEDINVMKSQATVKADFCIRVEGDSMLPTYHDNDIVLVKRCQDIEIGQVGIFIADNDKGYIKERGRTELISLNSDYKNIPIDESIRCVGIVLGTAIEI